MRLYSTEDSCARGEWSALAVLETFVAVAVAIWIAVASESLSLIAFWSLIGWMFLLRTEESAAAACRLFAVYYSAIDRILGCRCLFIPKTVFVKIHKPFATVGTLQLSKPYSGFRPDLRLWLMIERCWEILCFLTFVILLLMGTLAIKLSVGLRFLICHPIRSVFTIPENWIRSIGSLDLATPLEFVPGWAAYLREYDRQESEKNSRRNFLEKSRKLFQGPRIDDVRWNTLRDELSIREGLWIVLMVAVQSAVAWCVWHFRDTLLPLLSLHLDLILPLKMATLMIVFYFVIFSLSFSVTIVVGTPLRLLLHFPAYCYRLSLKATSITYFPLIWVIRQSVSTDSLTEQLEFVRDDKYSSLRRLLSWLLIGVIVFKVLCWSLIVRFKKECGNLIVDFFVDDYFTPTIQRWQIASLINSVMTLGFFYFLADRWLRRLKHNHPINEGLAWFSLRSLFLVTGLLGIYTFASNLWIILHHKPFLHLPPIGEPWWPQVP